LYLPLLAHFPHFEKKTNVVLLPSSLCVCMCIPSAFARQRLGNQVLGADNTHITVKELLTRLFLCDLSRMIPE
jgi:hypothetical protein